MLSTLLQKVRGVSISHRNRSETARCSVAQTRQRQLLAKIYPDDLKAQKGPPERACHFGQGCKMYDLRFVKLPHTFQLLLGIYWQ